MIIIYIPKYLQSDLLRGRQYSPYLCKERSMTIFHCSANLRKKIKIADSQSLPDNQLKQLFLAWTMATLLIKWKEDLGSFSAASETGTSCIDIKTFELNFQLNFVIKFRTFWCQFHIHYANESREIRNHRNKTNILEMHLMMTSGSLWISLKIRIWLKPKRRGWMCIILGQNKEKK